jgi:hypothetical protein
METTAEFQTESEVSGPTSVTPRLRLDAEYPSAHTFGFSSRVGGEQVLTVNSYVRPDPARRFEILSRPRQAPDANSENIDRTKLQL